MKKNCGYRIVGFISLDCKGQNFEKGVVTTEKNFERAYLKLFASNFDKENAFLDKQNSRKSTIIIDMQMKKILILQKKN